MGEEAFHEETIKLEQQDNSVGMANGIVLRQVYGDFDVHLGIGYVEHSKTWNHDWVNPTRMLTLTQDEVHELHGKLEQFLYARCTQCDGPVDGSEGAGDDGGLLCEECNEETESEED